MAGAVAVGALWADDEKCMVRPVPSDKPSAAQRRQIDRKYGMFIHFGINTFADQEWTDGTLPPTVYAPDTIDARQWVMAAKDAGMKYVILVAKHHDGFCLWDSPLTDYDVASSATWTDVVDAVARACKENGIGLGIYYSLWDRHVNPDTKNQADDEAYNAYMLAQIDELLDIAGRYAEPVEFWFDGGWEKPNYRWPIGDIYTTIKRKAPACQVGVNWTIGLPENPDAHPVTPDRQKEGFPIRYFPSDFRLGDPYLPEESDPKVFVHDGHRYYMPWESTVCLSERWFYNTSDHTYKSIDELEKLYRRATANDNILILNCPPGRDGRIRQGDIELLQRLKARVNPQ